MKKVADFRRRFVWAAPNETNRWHVRRRREALPLCGSKERTTDLSFDCMVSMHRDTACPDCVQIYYVLLAEYMKEST